MALGIFQRPVVDDNGTVQSAASVEVRVQETNALADIYSDRAGATPKANPFTTGADGLVKFFAQGNAYKITATKGAFAVTWEYVATGTAAELDIGDIEDLIDAAAGTPSLAPITNNYILANISGGTAAPSGHSINQILNSTLTNVQGAIPYRAAAAWTRILPGTSGQFLKTNGSGADPEWADISPPSTRVIKASAQAITSSASYVNDSELFFSAAAGTYWFRAVYTITFGAGGYQLAVAGPGGTTRLRVTANPLGVTNSVVAYDSIITGVTTAITGPVIVKIEGNVVLSSPGTFAMRIAQGASNAAATTFESGSFLEYQKII
jgi:hypothetical protein